MYRVKFTSRAAKELGKLPKPARKKIVDSLDVLRINPFAEILQFKKLKTHSDLYRIRVGTSTRRGQSPRRIQPCVVRAMHRCNVA